MNINQCGCRPYEWLGLDGNRCIRVIPRQLWINNYIQLNWNLSIEISLLLKISLFIYLLMFYLFVAPTTLATQYGHMN